MIHYLLLMNKQGQTRLARYFNTPSDPPPPGVFPDGFNFRSHPQRTVFEAEVIRKCLTRKENQCTFFSFSGHKVVYRRYASLFFIVGVDEDQNELATYELIHTLVEVLDDYFDNVCELDIMFNIDKVHAVVDEMFVCGYAAETIKKNILEPLNLFEIEE
eukprot:CAMPEP_0177631142 /NCGR_PEP_ID=MMETSP0447-20121125/1589_1 /TAXON_ID=0 /ORGANISM="Stygamoeba regulata, Strain BSH-02190019" /LENGTH=158 /DNA_ID=CAMNT_0019132601 /DNA_START=1 /DNA_END=477 /DNA_ORIENTATION=-